MHFGDFLRRMIGGAQDSGVGRQLEPFVGWLDEIDRGQRDICDLPALQSHLGVGTGRASDINEMACLNWLNLGARVAWPIVRERIANELQVALGGLDGTDFARCVPAAMNPLITM